MRLEVISFLITYINVDRSTTRFMDDAVVKEQIFAKIKDRILRCMLAMLPINQMVEENKKKY